MQIYLPIPLRSAAPLEFRALTYRIVGDGKTRILLTDNAHIGTFVARIVADPRTLNQAVIIWEDQASQLEAQEIGARVSGDGDKLKELYVNVSCCYRLRFGCLLLRCLPFRDAPGHCGGAPTDRCCC